tara:strand:+ start:1988 stop:3052 length:1065 start_codon:yes stop_codon:yes gene_type:complete
MKNLIIKKNDNFKKCLQLIRRSGSRGLIVVDDKKKLIGSLSDGDIRKAVLKKYDLRKKIEFIFNKKPIFLFENKYSYQDLKNLFYKKKLTVVPIVDNLRKVKKIITPDIFFNKKNLKLKKKNKFLSKVPCIIMAGGKGTRLEPFTHILPKPLIPIKKKPVIEHIIKNYENYGVRKFWISINYKSEIIKAYFKELKHSFRIKYITENKPLGTIGSLSKINTKIAKNFFITNCDTISNVKLDLMHQFHIKNNYDLTIFASSKTHQVPYGICHSKINGDLVKIQEKPKYNFLVNVGIYLAKNTILDYIPKNKKFHFTDLVKELKKNNKKIGLYTEKKNNWLDVGQWDEFKKTTSFFE